MTKGTLLEILEEYDNDIEICYQDKNNIYKYIPIHGFELIRPRNGKKRLVLLTTKLLDMSTMDKFNSQICTTREQSERLLALGLKKETADMFLHYNGGDTYVIRTYNRSSPLDIPAWSLHRLLCLYNWHYLEFMGETEIASAYDIVIEAIESAITGGYFNEKYLE